MTARAAIRQSDIASAIKAAQDSGLTRINIPVPVAFCSHPQK